MNLHNVSKISSRTESRKKQQHAKHFFFMKTEFSHSVSAQLIVSIVTFFYISVWIVSTWASSCRFWICCVGWLIPVQEGEKKKEEKKATRSSPRLYSPTSCPPPISASFMSFKNNSSLTNEARLIQRQPGCTNWAQHPFLFPLLPGTMFLVEFTLSLSPCTNEWLDAFLWRAPDAKTNMFAISKLESSSQRDEMPAPKPASYTWSGGFQLGKNPNSISRLNGSYCERIHFKGVVHPVRAAVVSGWWRACVCGHACCWVLQITRCRRDLPSLAA